MKELLIGIVAVAFIFILMWKVLQLLAKVSRYLFGYSRDEDNVVAFIALFVIASLLLVISYSLGVYLVDIYSKYG